MTYLAELVSLANDLDEKGLLAEASALDRIISRASEGSWEDGPTDDELMAMEHGGVDPTEEDRQEGLRERLTRLNLELSMFGEAISDGKMESEDWTAFLEIKEELSSLLETLGDESLPESEEDFS